jgi:hypothetical protein
MHMPCQRKYIIKINEMLVVCGAAAHIMHQQGSITCCGGTMLVLFGSRRI